MNNKKIGILTWHYYENFGSALQSLALQKTVSDLGHITKIINYRNPKFGKTTELKRFIQYCFCKCFPSIYYIPYLYFQKKFLHETYLTYDSSNVSRITKYYDTIIYGSDQIWAPNVFNSIYFGDQVECKKISYAASIGLSEIPIDMKEKYKSFIGAFDYVSVRENEGANLLKQIGINATVVLDPTLLIEANYYRKIARKPSLNIENYVFCYFLNEKHQYSEKVQAFCKLNSLIAIGKSADPSDSLWLKNIENIGPLEFLWLIDHAAYVITDSYHGTIFSLILGKKFVSFERFKNNDCINQNSRIFQLKQVYHLEHEIINIDDFDSGKYQCNYDYDAFNIKRKELREVSLDYLRSAIGDM